MRRQRHGVRSTVILCALAVFASSSASAFGQVRWRSGPSTFSGLTRRQVVNAIADGGSSGGPRHVLVQFDKPLTEADRAALEGAGVTLTGYVGDHAFFAAISPDGPDHAALSTVAPLVDARDIQPAWKLHPVLARGERPEWAIVPVPDEKTAEPGAGTDTWVAAYILFHADVHPDIAVGTAQSFDAVVRRSLRTVNALVVEMPLSLITALAADDSVQYIEPALPPLDMVNDGVRAATQANEAQAPPYSLDGTGVSVLVYDGGTARATHVDFQGRLRVRDTSPLDDHPTHVSGIIGGAGVANPLYKGMAPGVIIESYGFETGGPLQPGFLYTDPGDIEVDYDEAINVYGADIANNSIGSNTAPNGFPCEWEGDYGVTDAVIDSIVRGSLGSPFRIVWANGNERQGSQRCGATYHTTAPPACAKNHITVGALNSNDDSVTSFTSWGPADDGRIKPDLSAPGCQSDGDNGVTSTFAASDTAYGVYCGTSMASPTVCGASALLLQDYRAHFPGSPDPRNSTLKAMLIQNCADLGAVGPDYQSGYGAVRIRDTIDFVRTGSFIESQVDQDGAFVAVVSVTAGDAQLKATLAWDDAPAAPNVVPALVNDLDLRVFDPTGAQHFPWTLGGLADPAAPAVRTQADHVNNVEQVVVDAPMPGLWRIEVYGFNVPQGPQPLSLCTWPHFAPDCNQNGVTDIDDIAMGTSQDCNHNNIPDECEPMLDCNTNGVVDICDIGTGASADVNQNSIPDECEPDCNGNLIPDDYDIATGSSGDCNANAVPDECDIAGGVSQDCSGNGVPDECETDCNGNGVSDDCDISAGTSADCNVNGLPDECEMDCNNNGIADECDIAAGTSEDLNDNGFPDECVRLLVDLNAVGANDGSDWNDAFTNLQDALAYAVANQDIREIWVAEGRHTPAGPGGDQNATFTLPDGVKLYGGFSGNESLLYQRDWNAHETVLSGDLNGDDAPDWGNSGDNSFHVVTGDSLGSATLLDGFTISGGYNSFAGGAGITLTNSLLQVKNCRLTRNLVGFTHGGAVFVWDGHPTFSNCTFDGNYVHLGKGGGIYLYGTAAATVRGCSFYNNTSVGSTSGSPEAAGAAIAHWGEGALTIVDSVFDYNVARGFYTGGSNGSYAGAIDHFGPGPLSVDRCVFTDNTSNEGGAIFSWRNATITNSVFARNRAPQFNSAVGWGGQGGAVGLSSFFGTAAIVANCVFYGNSAEDAGGIGAYGAASLAISNSILWNNTDNRGNIGASQVVGASVRYSCIMNMLVGQAGEDPPDPASFPGSTDADPLFVDAPGGDFHVDSGSPCIDAGDNGALPSGILRDLDGRFRYLDDPSAPDGGLGASPIVDMGAYEFGAVGNADFDGDGDVDFFDYSVVYACYTGPDAGPAAPGCAPFDLDVDDDVDLVDVGLFQNLFTGGEPPLSPPATIAGVINYTGPLAGVIHVVAAGTGSIPVAYQTSIAGPGAYQLSVLYAGAYNVSAYLDVNGNGALDADEPKSVSAANPVMVTQAGQTIGGVDVALGGLSTIAGHVLYDDGYPAYNIAMSLSGAMVDSTQTDFEGAYAFVDLSDGAYTVTPSSATRYFYPYFTAVDVTGADVIGVDFVAHVLPSGDVDGEISGTVVAVDAPNYNFTLDDGDALITFYVYIDTIYSGAVNGLEDLQVGYQAMVQYYTSANLAVEVDAEP